MQYLYLFLCYVPIYGLYLQLKNKKYVLFYQKYNIEDGPKIEINTQKNIFNNFVPRINNVIVGK